MLYQLIQEKKIKEKKLILPVYLENRETLRKKETQ